MKNKSCVLAVFALLTAGASWAGTITVVNNSGITVPETRVYKNCLSSTNAQIFGSLAPYTTSAPQTRTALLAGCAWAREVGIEPRYISCATPGVVPNDPAQVIVTWTGTSADDLECAVTVVP